MLLVSSSDKKLQEIGPFLYYIEVLKDRKRREELEKRIPEFFFLVHSPRKEGGNHEIYSQTSGQNAKRIYIDLERRLERVHCSSQPGGHRRTTAQWKKLPVVRTSDIGGTRTLSIERFQWNAFNGTLSMERFQSDVFNQMLSIKRFQSNTFNQTLSIKHFQWNAFNGTLAIKRLQSNACNQTLAIK